MAISIVLPEPSEARTSKGTRYYNQNGAEIEDVTKATVFIESDSYIYAKVEVCLGKLDYMDNIHALLGTETLQEIGKLHSANMNLVEFDTTALLAEIIRREKLVDAPVKIQLAQGHKEICIGIGKDDVANIIIHKDALTQLNKINGK